MGRLDKIRRALESCRARPHNVTGTELADIAKSLGRLEFPGNHPTYCREGWAPIQIPAHGSARGGTLKIKTAKNILNQLEKDLEGLEQEEQQGDDDE